eukprot:TRINITY_DN3761_c0_g1_i2.p1 TRINITY_DN3761_c0_g1~~TRINITY_DN3761_c0_g1_i2.p1  ORF type:complete len:142 (+),score=6.43 TRINITY_DN3761_c0_g1_i2:241-666(+)
MEDTHFLIAVTNPTDLKAVIRIVETLRGKKGLLQVRLVIQMLPFEYSTADLERGLRWVLGYRKRYPVLAAVFVPRGTKARRKADVRFDESYRELKDGDKFIELEDFNFVGIPIVQDWFPIYRTDTFEEHFVGAEVITTPLL